MFNLMNMTKTKYAFSGSRASSDNQQNELSKQAAKVWNKMDPELRKPYVEEARKEKEWHRRMYPDYMYSPVNANGKGKSLKKKVKEGTKGSERDKEMSSASKTGKSAEAIQRAAERFWLQHEFDASAISQSAPAAAPSAAAEQTAFQNSTALSAEFHPWGTDYETNGQFGLQYHSHDGFLVPMEDIPPLALCPSSGFEEVQYKDDNIFPARNPLFFQDLP